MNNRPLQQRRASAVVAHSIAVGGLGPGSVERGRLGHITAQEVEVEEGPGSRSRGCRTRGVGEGRSMGAKGRSRVQERRCRRKRRGRMGFERQGKAQ